jgi:hypothetical protein
MPHLFIAVTAHGYGHLAQVAPVAIALSRRIPGLRITLQGTVDVAYCAERMPAGYRHVAEAADVALPMDGPLQVRWLEGLAAFVDFEADYDRHLKRQVARLEEDRPDLVLADIPWLPLDAAKRLGIPAVGLCSLNWHDILVEGPIGDQMPRTLADRLRQVYGGADLFLRPAPSMPMAWLPNGRDIGPIGARHRCAPDDLRHRLGIDAEQRLVLLQFGGAGRLALGGPRIRGICFLTPDAAAASGRDDIVLIGGEGQPGVLDVLTCCDAIITKPGYGTFAEAACNGIPVAYVPRPDWPEAPYLIDWLAQRVPVQAIPAEDLAAGRVEDALSHLFASGPAEPVAPSGVDEAADLIQALLTAG